MMAERAASRGILVVDDDSMRRSQTVSSLRRLGHEPLEAESSAAARELLVDLGPALVIVDMGMGQDAASFVLRFAAALEPAPRLIATSAAGSVHQAVEAMRLSAMTVLQHPVEPAHLDRWVSSALELPAEVVSNRWLADKPAPRDPIGPTCRLLRGASATIERIYRLIARVGPSDTNVLVTGESGVGKELIAKEIHAASRRSTGPLVTVNCAAIPESLLESELFGHKRGAFTNATSDRDGRFKQAEGGTIFLDEIGEMRLDLQAKLLRVLQEREFTPVGGNETIRGNFRVVAATNQKLEELVAGGGFRKDLYYRLSVFPLEVAPLRDRKDDIPELVEHFIAGFNDDRACEITGIDTSVMLRLMAHDWPGNVRELQNVVERMVILRGDGDLLVEDLPDRLAARPLPEPAAAVTPPHAANDELPEEGVDLKTELINFEVRMIRRALEQTGGNRNQAARLLRLNRTTLVEKIKRHQISA